MEGLERQYQKSSTLLGSTQRPPSHRVDSVFGTLELQEGCPCKRQAVNEVQRRLELMGVDVDIYACIVYVYPFIVGLVFIIATLGTTIYTKTLLRLFFFSSFLILILKS